MHEGHRKRIMSRVAEDAEGMQDHELLEILLFNVVPRANTNPTAHALLAAFGSLDGVLRASTEQLTGVEGVGEATALYLGCVAEVFERVRTAREERPAIFNAHTFASYAAARFSALTEEIIEVYCLDGKDRVRCIKRFTSHEADRALADPEELCRFVVSQHPRGIIIAHNHPGAPARPSPEDDAFTAQVQLLCSFNNVRLSDHVIVGEGETYSYFTAGRLEEFRDKFCVAEIVRRSLS